jgi:hypothetical protein
MPGESNSALTESLRRLRAYPFFAAAVHRLRGNSTAIAEALREAVLHTIPAYTESHNPDVLPELGAHTAEHATEVLRLLGGGATGLFEFVVLHAHRRAEQHFPLEATLHAYRCGHKVLSRLIRETVLAVAPAGDDAQAAVADVADFAIEYTDTVSTLAASAYIDRTRLLADVAGDQRTELMTILLDGYDESDRRVAKVLRSAGYLSQRQSFCVAVAESVEPSEMLNPARARRLADAIDKLLRGFPGRRLVDIRDNKVVLVCSHVRRASGWTAPRSTLASRVAAALQLAGPAVLIGVSNDVPATSMIPSAFREALLALELADVSNRVAQLSDVPMRRLLVHLAATGLQKELPAWSREFFELVARQRGVLLATLCAYADADMNVLRAAESLGVHPNTLYARFQRIRQTTGLDPRRYHALSELLAVADCHAAITPASTTMQKLRKAEA